MDWELSSAEVGRDLAPRDDEHLAPRIRAPPLACAAELVGAFLI